MMFLSFQSIAENEIDLSTLSIVCRFMGDKIFKMHLKTQVLQCVVLVSHTFVLRGAHPEYKRSGCRMRKFSSTM